MGFMTMLLTNPFLYYWIVERIINEVKNLSMRLKKVGSMRPLNRVAKTQSESRSRERLLHKDTQNAERFKESVTSTSSISVQDA